MWKSLFDRTIALVSLVALSPLLLLLFAMILFSLGTPVLFTQVRTGLGGKPFKLYKLRTMQDLRDDQNELLTDEARLSPLGAFLRRFSLDELPQLLNVVRGELSLVGPRPLMHKYWAHRLYSPAEARRYDVKPGITGWAQINGRNELSWQEKFELDTWYVDHQSLALDLKILCRTLWSVLAGRGISQNGHATAEEFRGTPPLADSGPSIEPVPGSGHVH